VDFLKNHRHSGPEIRLQLGMENLLKYSALILNHDLHFKCTNPRCLQLSVYDGRLTLSFVDFDMFDLIILVSSDGFDEDHHLRKLLFDGCLQV
jgi:hypothetical protein